MDDLARPRMVGAPVRRVEDPRLLTGRGRFAADMLPRGTLHVAIRRSDHAHARILRIDAADAAAVAGARVFTGADLAALVRPLHAASRMPGYHATPLLPLARDVVRYVGEPVAAIVAPSRYLAEDAAERLVVDYDPLPCACDPEHAARSDAPVLYAEAGTNVLVARSFAREDAAAAMEGAAHRVRARLRFTRKTPGAIEPRACLAEYDRGEGSLTVHTATQIPGIVRDALAEALDMPGHRVRVLARDVGGGFGAKASLYPEELLVAALSRHLARPVRWVSDRLEDLLATTQAFDAIVDAELGLDADGAIVALTADVLGDVGAASVYPWTAALEPVQVVSFLPGPYRVPAYRGAVRAVATPKAPTGPYRGVGRPIAAFAMERLIDMAAARLDVDPVSLRLRNLVRPEEFPYKTGSGIVWDRSGFTECLERARDAIGYDALRAEQARARAEGRWFGIGFGCYAELTGIGSRISAAPGMPINTGTETALIRVDATGSVTAAFGVASHGQGLETALAQIVADELGARMEDIRIVQGDSDAVANATGTYASRSAVLAGGAAILSSRTVKQKLLAVAAHLLEASTDDIEITDGSARIAGTDRAVTLREIARAVYADLARLPRALREEVGELSARETYDPYFGTTSAAAHACAVEIDRTTHAVRILRYVVAEDCGRIINPMIVDGQVHGGVAQGVGVALYEEMVHDPRGQVLTASLADYLLPTSAEVPFMEVVHLETESPSTLGGFRGMGEGGTIGAPAAIANAVADALRPLGVEITTLPLTPDRLFRLVAAATNTQDGGEVA
jgi:carbon-monoxide dehydrogenase large subunit